MVRYAALALFVTSTAYADVPVPGQELCTVEIQQRDGSRCEACGYLRFSENREGEPCSEQEDRGLTERCAFGGTYVSAVWCDREADFEEVGRTHRQLGDPPPIVDPSAPPAPAHPAADPARPAPAASPGPVAAQEPASGDCAASPTRGSPTGWALALIGLAMLRTRD